MPNAAISDLRDRIARLEGGNTRERAVLPFGVAAIDNHLPGGGVALGALHEVAGGGNGAIDGAAASLFAAGIAARTPGKVLWCVTRQDLFAPAIAQVGLHPDRVIYVEADRKEGGMILLTDELRERPLANGRERNADHAPVVKFIRSAKEPGSRPSWMPMATPCSVSPVSAIPSWAVSLSSI